MQPSFKLALKFELLLSCDIGANIRDVTKSSEGRQSSLAMGGAFLTVR